MEKIRFLTLEQVLLIHNTQIERYGGRHGLRDLALLESAVFRPQTSFGGQDLYPTVFDKAVAITHSLVLNHAFLDGNKRSGVFSAVVFLKMNGYELITSLEDFEEATMKVENKKWGHEEIVEWLKKNSRKS